MAKHYMINSALQRITSLALFILFFAVSSCRAPRLMQTANDGHHLKANESAYIGKPLKTLLKEIKPPIKMVWGVGERQAHGAPSYFVFWFHDREAQADLRKVGRIPPRVTVYVRDTFAWNRQGQPLPQLEQWTKKDASKYGNLTIAYFRYSGTSL